MFELSIDSHFAAAHCLKGYKGDCARLHGHTWGVTVTVEANNCNEIGISYDFKDISKILDEIVKRFDHQTLNDLEEFKDINPTAENLAELIFNLLSGKMNDGIVSVVSVTVSESDKYRVTYKKKNK